MREVAIVGEDGAEDAPGGRGFQVAVEAGLQVGRREVHAAITAVTRRRDGGGVGGPHAGGGTHRAQQLRSLLAGRLQHLGVAAGEAEVAQCAEVRALLRQQNPLCIPQIRQRLHLVEALQRGFAWVGGQPAVAHRGHVAMRQAGVVVVGPTRPSKLIS